MIESDAENARRPRRRRRHKTRARNHWLERLEYLGVGLFHSVFSHVPPHRIATLLICWGRLSSHFARRRRQIALNNLRQIYHGTKSDKEIKRIASHSIGSFILSIAEHSWFRRLLDDPGKVASLSAEIRGLDDCLATAKELHERTSGCIFVTPHFGVYGLLPYLFSACRIPLVIPINTPGSEAIYQRWLPLNTQRSPHGEVFVPKRNSLGSLRAALREGRSVGMVADQRALRGVAVDFLGRAATTTPIPALLALTFGRPIVVAACWRTSGQYRYEMTVAEPIWPEQTRKLQPIVVRMTEQMNRTMGEIILSYPEQYFWVHDRWKSDSSKARLSDELSTIPEAGH